MQELGRGIRANPLSLLGYTWLVVYIEDLLFQTSRWFP